MTPEHLTTLVADLEAFVNNGKMAQAEATASELLDNPKLIKEPELNARTLVCLSLIYSKRHELKKALANALQAQKLAKQCSNKIIFLKSLLQSGVVYHQLSDFQKALDTQHHALELAKKLESKQDIVKALNSIGVIYSDMADYVKALEFLHQSLILTNELEDTESILVSTGNLGVVYRKISDFPKAIEYYHRALALSEKIGDKRGIAKSMGNLGVVYNELSDYSKSLEFTYHALALFEELGDKAGIARNKCYLAHAYHNLQDYPKALQQLQEALLLFEEMGHKNSVATQTSNIGAVYSLIPDFQMALDYFHRAMVLNESLGNKRDVAINGGNIGKIYATKEFEGYNPGKAEDYLLKAIAMNKELGIKKVQSTYERSLSDLYKIEKRWEECHRHFENFYELEKELHLEDAKKKAEQLSYERQETEREKQQAIAKAKHEATEQLLFNVLPPVIAQRMLDGATIIAEKLPSVSVLFADIVGFTRLSQRITPEQIIQGLDRIFSEFDTLAEKYNLEKIKTIGDCYMVVAGAPKARSDHAEVIALFALDMQKVIKKYKAISTGEEIMMRIGIHTGEAIAGVIGKKKFAYDLWGDTVNTASRMESHGVEGKIHVSAEFADALKETSFQFILRGEMDVKGKGIMKTYFLSESLTEANN